MLSLAVTSSHWLSYLVFQWKSQSFGIYNFHHLFANRWQKSVLQQQLKLLVRQLIQATEWKILPKPKMLKKGTTKLIHSLGGFEFYKKSFSYSILVCYSLFALLFFHSIDKSSCVNVFVYFLFFTIFICHFSLLCWNVCSVGRFVSHGCICFVFLYVECSGMWKFLGENSWAKPS